MICNTAWTLLEAPREESMPLAKNKIYMPSVLELIDPK